jgi:hypothetical protein
MDIFKDDAFGLIALTEAVEKMPFLPSLLGSMNIFKSESTNLETIGIEEKSGSLSLITTSQRGAPIEMQDRIARKLRQFSMPRLAKGSQVFARQVQGLRAFGTETELESVVNVIAQEQVRLKQDLEYTMEYHRLGALQGILLDADGSTTLYNFFTEFGISQPAEIDFNLDAASPVEGVLRTLISNSVVRPILRALGATPTGSGIMALCGDDFFDAFVNHNDVRVTYKNWEAASDLRAGTAFRAFRFADVDWVNYRGSDDNSEIAIAATKVKFFPMGVPGVFRRVNGPGETMETVNTMGKEFYSMLVTDKDRNMWVQPEVYAYPLHICTRPEILLRGKLT